MRLLVVNTGSSSVRLALYAFEANALQPISAQRYSGDVQPENTLREFLGSEPVDAVAHRVVHGGTSLTAPCVIDADVEAEIESLAQLAPLHNPRALAWIQASRALPGATVKQVGVFDTGFYATLPEVARSYALPQQLVQRLGLRRYGFHGIAHQAMLRRWQHLQPGIAKGGRVISLQLGAGCSITASSNGLPQDTSMGFSPLEGLVMATRSGDIDPGLLLHLLRNENMSVDEMDHLLNRESGLRGMAGESDMRKLLVSTDLPVQTALDLYCYRARKYVGSYLAALGGTDAILFGGGVGEHTPGIRERILAGMEWAGIVLHHERNHATAGTETRISRDDSQVEVWSIPVDEARLIAEEAANLLLNR
jgi:acetate kinase